MITQQLRAYGVKFAAVEVLQGLSMVHNMALVRASICKLSSVGERRRALADAVRKIYIRASQAQRPSNQIVRKCHVTGRCVFIGTR